MSPRARALVCLFGAAWMALGQPLAHAAGGRERADDGETDLCKSAVSHWLGSAIGGPLDEIDDLVLDPIVEYFTNDDDPATPADDAILGATAKFLEGGIKVGCSACGLAIDGGRFLVGQLEMQIREFHDQGRRITAGRMIFGGTKAIDAYMGPIPRLMTEASFFEHFGPPRGFTEANIGQRVRTAENLRHLWFTSYRAFLQGRVGAFPGVRMATIDDALRDGWPLFERYWAAQRAGEVLDRLSDTFPTLRMPCLPLVRSVADAVDTLAGGKFPKSCKAANSELVVRGKEQTCACRTGYLWNADGTACILEPAVQVRLAQCVPGAQPAWDIASEQVICQCRPGLAWNEGRTACTEPWQAQVAAARCQPNAEAYWNGEMQKVRCRCIAGHAWNIERTACVPEVEAQLAQAPCEKRDANSSTYIDRTGRLACRCNAGFEWNRAKGACRAQEAPDSDMTKLLDDVDANRANAAAAARGERAATNDARDRALGADDGPSAARRSAEGSTLMTTLLQGLTIAVAQSQGVPVPAGVAPIPGLPIPGIAPAAAGRAATPPPQGGARASTGSRTPAAGSDEFYMIVASALPSSDERYRKYPACRYKRPVVRSALVSGVAGGKQEIEAAANTLRSRGHEGVQVSYHPERLGSAPFEPWARAEDAGYDACWQAVRSAGAR